MTSNAIKIIKPHSERSALDDLRAIWTSRELLLVLARREIAIRYRQAVIGFLWVVLQPLITTAIFTIVFMVFVRIPSDGQPYPLFAFSGLVVWQFFSRIVVDGTGSLVANTALITKVSFPRQVIPLVPPLAAALDCMIAILALLVIALAFGAHVQWTIVFIPVILLAITFFGYAIVLWLAPLNAIYRDIGITVPFIMQVGMYLSPVVYPASLVPEKIRWLYQLNPAAVMVDSMRWAVLGSTPPSLAGVALFIGLSIALFWGGGRFFRNVEGTLVDRI